MLLTCIKRYLVLVVKTNFGLLFEWLLKTGFTVCVIFQDQGIVCPADRRPYFTHNTRRRPTYRDVPCDTSIARAKLLPIFVTALSLPCIFMLL